MRKGKRGGKTDGVDGLAAVNASVGLGDVAGIKEACHADAVLLFGQSVA